MGGITDDVIGGMTNGTVISSSLGEASRRRGVTTKYHQRLFLQPTHKKFNWLWGEWVSKPALEGRGEGPLLNRLCYGRDQLREEVLVSGLRMGKPQYTVLMEGSR
jgi:hypothetical protein